MNANFIVTGSILLFIVLFSATPAHAYLDPGTGSVILQGVLGAIAAIAVVTKLYWHRILRFLGLSKKRTALEQKVRKAKIKDERTNNFFCGCSIAIIDGRSQYKVCLVLSGFIDRNYEFAI